MGRKMTYLSDEDKEHNRIALKRKHTVAIINYYVYTGVHQHAIYVAVAK